MLLTISVTVIAAIMVVALLVQIPILLKVRRTAREIEGFFETARTQIIPLSHDLTTLSGKIQDTLQSIHRQSDILGESMTTVRDTAVRLQNLHKIGDPLVKFPVLVRGVIRGAGAFVSVFLR
ncbi:MAG: DUF948 domain-containing protein [Thermodesulfobacteriota bacterium]